MNHPANVASDKEFLDSFIKKTYYDRIPIDGSFEITHRCNLKCVHCYLGDQENIREHRQQELSTDEIKTILDDLVAAGTLNITFTGGDPMMRKDFAEIYTYAIKLGMVTTVFCDGVLVTDKMVELFNQYPPRELEISIYGATTATYENVTKIKGSFKKFMAGINRLKNNGVRFRLKTVLLSLNKHEFNDMQKIAKDMGVKFHYDTAVFPCLPHNDNGGQANKGPSEVHIDLNTITKQTEPALTRDAPMDYRLSPDEVAAIDLADDKKKEEWLEYYERKLGVAKGNELLYTCGAGKSTFHIDPYGYLYACILSERNKYDLRSGSFLDGWNGEINKINSVKARESYGCNDCDMRALCLGCPALFDLETGSPDVKSEHICKTTQTRYNAMKELIDNYEESQAHEIK